MSGATPFNWPLQTDGRVGRYAPSPRPPMAAAPPARPADAEGNGADASPVARRVAAAHGIDLAAHCDHTVAALTHAAEVSTARIHRLLDPAVTGLPAQLARVQHFHPSLSELVPAAAERLVERR